MNDERDVLASILRQVNDTEPSAAPPPKQEARAKAPETPAQEPAPAKAANTPVDAPWRYTEDMLTWSGGYPTKADAIVAAREAGPASVYVGKAVPIEQDLEVIALDVLDALRYRQRFDRAQLKKIGAKVEAAVGKLIGPAVTFTPDELIDLAKQRPASFDELGARVAQGYYAEHHALFAADLAALSGVEPGRVTPLLARYEPEELFAVIAALLMPAA